MAEYKQLIGLSKNIGGSLLAKPTSSGGISFTYGIPAVLGIAGVTAVGLGLKSLFSSNNPDRMNSENPIETLTEPTNNSTITSTPENIQSNEKSVFQRAGDWVADTGRLTWCVLTDWFSEQSPECAAFQQRAKNDKGIYAKLTSLTSWAKGLLIGGVALTVVIPLLKLAFDRYARTGHMSVVQPEIKPDIKPEIKPNINPEFKNEIKPEIKPEFNLDYEPNYDPDYNPNLLQNYVPTINVNTAKQPAPQIVIQPRGTVFVPYENGKKFTRKLHHEYDWLFE